MVVSLEVLVEFLEEFGAQDYASGGFLRVLGIDHNVYSAETRILHRFIFLEFWYLEPAPRGKYAGGLRSLLLGLRIRLWLAFLRLIPIVAASIVIESGLFIVVEDLSLQVLLTWLAIKSVFKMLRKEGRCV